ncbi:hypothetical protein [Sphingomonas sp.]|uniref:hypothetical protein n=1 Tax=Sphingomonas sp. TaxID=28214 RepID=UPI00286CA9DF|nr:hypothetical protein [Sphingomonas sp.]
MAKFCETLAETGMVVDACLAAGKSRAGAYALRQRDPLFAAAWDTALGLARMQLSDALLARSIEGSVERFSRDGALVGEKRYFDNRLGFAVLKRLDRVAETGSALPVLLRRQEPRSTQTGPLPSQGNRREPLAWDQMIGALRSGDPGAMAVAMAALKAHEDPQADDVDKIDTAQDSLVSADDEAVEDPKNSVWRSHEDWWTDFPPPAGHDGVEHGNWGSRGYRRTCTAEEAALMDSATALDQAGERAAQDADLAAYFADVAAELADAKAAKTVTPTPEPGPA